MDARSDHEQLFNKQPIRAQPYIGHEPLQLLARMIARTILRSSVPLNSINDVAKQSVPIAEQRQQKEE